MATSSNASVQPRRVLNALFRHRGKMFLVACLVLMLTFAALVLWPRSYESEAKLFVRIGRENVTLDPTATTGQTVAFQKHQEEEINSVLEILNSRETVQRVVDAVGPSEVLSPSSGQAVAAGTGPNLLSAWTSSLESISDTLLTTSGLRDPVSDREEAIRKLANRFEATAARRSGVVTLRCSAASPAAAQRLVAAATDGFLEHHAGLSRTAGTHEFFSEQVNLLHDQLAEAAGRLRDLKTEYGIVTIQGTQDQLLQELSDVELAALETHRELGFAQSRTAELQRSIAGLPEKVVTGETSGTNLARSGLESQLFALKQEEQELLSRMTPGHPSVTQIRAQRESMEKIIEQQVPDRTAATEAPNPLRQALFIDLLREQAGVAALAERKRVLDAQLAELRQKGELLNRREVELAELQRDVDSLESKYQSHVDKLEQARIDEALLAGSISSINVVQPATFVERPVSPQKRLALAAGLMLALFGSLGTALVLESTDPTIRTEEQLETLLDLPVMATISDRQMPRARRRFFGSGRLASASPLPYQVVAGRIAGLAFHASPEAPRKAVTLAIVNCDSSLPGSVAAELAVSAIGMSDAPVLLVDADTVRRRAGDRFHANGAVGLTDVLSGRADLEACLRESGVNNLSLLTSGSTQAPASVDLRQMRRRLEPLSGRYGLMIADLPAATDGVVDVLAAREFDAVLLVVEAERTRVDAARRIKQQLCDGGANVLGCLLHGQKDYVPSWLQRFA